MKIFRIAIVITIILILLAFFYFTLDKDPQALLINSVENLSSHFIWMILIVFGMTLISTLTGLPVLYLGVALGFFTKFLPALGLAWGMNLVAITITYFMVNRVFSESFRKKFGRKKLIKGINRRIDKYGLWTVAFSRAVYIIPTNIINFSFPLSRISRRQYVAGTMIGLIPECLINVATGYLLRHELLLLSSPEQNLIKILVIGGFILLLSALFLMLRYRKNKLEKTRIRSYVPLLDE